MVFNTNFTCLRVRLKNIYIYNICMKVVCIIYCLFKNIIWDIYSDIFYSSNVILYASALSNCIIFTVIKQVLLYVKVLYYHTL